MRKPLTIGMLAETKNRWERRAPLTPEDVSWLLKRKIPVEIESSSIRIFNDKTYKRAGAKIVSRFQKAKFLIGIKEPDPKDLLADRLYALFSHITKGQPRNRVLLKTFLKKRVTLIDYEHMTDARRNRTVYFGRFAGICGMIDSLHFLGKRRLIQGYTTPLSFLRRALDYGSYEKAKRHLRWVGQEIRRAGFDPRLSPFIIGITGHGNVARGAEEVLDLFHPIEVHPQDMASFIRHQKKRTRQVYKIMLQREEKLRSKKRKGFYFEDYLEHPKRYESNLDHYLPLLNMLINASYWDRRFPRLVPESMVRKLYRRKNKFRLGLIGDLTCDVRGTIEITKKATDPGNPTYVYHPKTGKIEDGIAGEGIAILAVDQLPCEFPEDASREFSSQIRDYVYQIASHGATDITQHVALPAEIRRGVIMEKGKFTPAFKYMRRYV
jgi:alanine dehydrogenase